jgi:microcystin-dependent protein
LIWSGQANNLPTGFVLCDGNNSTPDLRGKFVVGYSNTDNDYDVGDTGGNKNITLTTSNLPSHTHGAGNYSAVSAGAHTHTYSSATQTNRVDNDETHQYLYSNTTQNTGSAGAHTHSVSGTSGATGGGSSFDNRPPYYALCYIMKT